MRAHRGHAQWIGHYYESHDTGFRKPSVEPTYQQERDPEAEFGDLVECLVRGIEHFRHEVAAILVQYPALDERQAKEVAHYRRGVKRLYELEPHESAFIQGLLDSERMAK
jgi:hypothetical protein